MAKPDFAHQQTDKELEKLEKRIAMIYRNARNDLDDTVTAYFAQYQQREQKQRDLLAAGKITDEEFKQWRLAQIGRGKRFEALRDKMAERYTNANAVAVSYTNDATPSIYSLNRNYAAYTIEESGADVDFTLFNEQAVRRLIVEEPELMPYYPEKRALRRDIDLAYGKKQITASVTSGILQGKSIPKISKDLQDRMENMNRVSAIRTARTAITSAQNAGRMDGYHAAEQMGIEMQKEWMATLDNRTRHAHAALDGQRRKTDEPFEVDGEQIMFPGDFSAEPYLVYNCRCTLVAYLPKFDKNGEQKRKTYQKWEMEKSENRKDTISFAKETAKIKWLPKGEPLSKEQYRELRDYASEMGVTLSGFKDSDVDVELVKEYANVLGGLLEKYPEVKRNGKFVLELSDTMESVDFAESRPRFSHMIILNADAVRNKEKLTEEIQDMVDSKWTVYNADYNSIIYHEFGHLLCTAHKIDPLKVSKKVLHTDSRDDVFDFVEKNVSEYAISQKDGDEIISEVFSMYRNGDTSDFVLEFLKKCSII